MTKYKFFVIIYIEKQKRGRINMTEREKTSAEQIQDIIKFLYSKEDAISIRELQRELYKMQCRKNLRDLGVY